MQNDVHDVCLFKLPPSCSAGTLSSVVSSNHQGESREVLLEMIVHCCRLHGVQLRLVVPWQMGVGHDVGLQRKCGSAVLACAAQQSLWHCMEACHALGCLGSARRERRMTDESAVTHRGKICRRQDLRFGPNGLRSGSFHDERNLELDSSSLSYDFLPVCSFSAHLPHP